MQGLPLYKDAHEAPPVRVARGNYGLAYDKFGDQWTVRGNDADFDKAGKDSNQVSGWLGRFHGKNAGSEKLLLEAACRRRKLVENLGSHLQWLRTDWAFVTGLGRSHPMENGFAWHHSLGVPYLPGSGVKGVLRSWAVEEGLQDERIDRLFGPRRTDGSGRTFEASQGSILFFDALPCLPVELRAEVMTNHYGDWYGTSRDARDGAWPADWTSPNPVCFLAVAPGNLFAFALAKASPNVPDEDLEWAYLELPRALEELGAGAKTATGYGRFSKCEPPAKFKEAWDEFNWDIGAKRSHALFPDEETALDAALRLFEAAVNGENPDQEQREILAGSHFVKEWKLGRPGCDKARNVKDGVKKLKALARFLLGEDPQADGPAPAQVLAIPEGGKQAKRLQGVGSEGGLDAYLELARMAVQHDDWSPQECAWILAQLKPRLKGKDKKKHKALVAKLTNRTS